MKTATDLGSREFMKPDAQFPVQIRNALLKKPWLSEYQDGSDGMPPRYG